MIYVYRSMLDNETEKVAEWDENDMTVTGDSFFADRLRNIVQQIKDEGLDDGRLVSAMLLWRYDQPPYIATEI